MSTAQPPANPLPLPDALNPDAFDVLSELAHLLTRLRTLPPASSTGTSTAAGGATPSQSQSQSQSQPQSQPQPHSSGAGAGAGASHSTPTATALLASKKNSELTLKEIPVAADALKHRFQRARTLVRTALPDLDRGIPDQEAEIGALEARIARQRDTLAKLRGVGAQLAVQQAEGDADKMEE
ncbi:RNA polymerase II transcription mediator complex subunit 9-domain-containing protein [Xylaria palmicola]|nr:RNA polymerase II transcription mediator complex subunit 9-domain-containing protein [Xylaria palmicola]